MPNPQPRLALARGRRHRARTVDPNPVWPREKMLALLGLIGLAAVLVVVGLGFAISHALRPAPATSQPDGGASPAAATSVTCAPCAPAVPASRNTRWKPS